LTDQEFELLDALYFVASFEELKAELHWEEFVLRDRLLDLYHKGWLKCLNYTKDEEVDDLKDFEFQYKNYHYLASKEGLLAHNSK